MKIFTLAAAIQEGVFNPNEGLQSGTYVIDPKSKPIRDHNGGRGWGTISYLKGYSDHPMLLLQKLRMRSWF